MVRSAAVAPALSTCGDDESGTDREVCAHETNVAQSGPAVFEASCRLPRPASGPGVLQVAGSWWRRRGHRPASTSTSVMRNHHALPAARRHRRRRTSSSSIYAASPEGQLSMVAASGVPHGDDIGVESVGFVPATGASAAYLADRSTPRSGKPHAAPTASCVSTRPHHLQREPIRVTCWCSLRGVSAWRFPLARPGISGSVPDSFVLQGLIRAHARCAQGKPPAVRRACARIVPLGHAATSAPQRRGADLKTCGKQTHVVVPRSALQRPREARRRRANRGARRPSGTSAS